MRASQARPNPLASGADADRSLLPRREHADLVAIRIGKHDPSHLALADVHRAGTEPDEPRDFSPVIISLGWCDVEVHPVLGLLRGHAGRSERDEGTRSGGV